jgi:2-amino-4-hydroxy-6-hydroxymethyldihydropteridine diphosphokinase
VAPVIGDDAVGTEAVVALGANLADREAALRGAVAALDAADGVAVREVSTVVETAPVGGPDQPDYYNAVAIVATTLRPAELLAVCHGVEADFGRVRHERWGARTLDLDLVSFGVPGEPSEVVDADPHLTLPHPRAHERAFVLVPWAQLRPDALLRVPDGSLRLVRELADAAADRSGLRAAPVGALR